MPGKGILTIFFIQPPPLPCVFRPADPFPGYVGSKHPFLRWVVFFFFPEHKRKGRNAELSQRSPGPGSSLRRSRRSQAAFVPTQWGAGIFSRSPDLREEEGGRGEIGARESGFCWVPVEPKPPRRVFLLSPILTRRREIFPSDARVFFFSYKSHFLKNYFRGGCVCGYPARCEGGLAATWPRASVLASTGGSSESNSP